jgi:predicted RNA binding protein YcfA (HicA-like mRNA interferase family)
MPRHLPPLSYGEVLDIIKARGFVFHRQGKGSHSWYKGYVNNKTSLVMMDSSIDEYSGDLLQSVIHQSTLSRVDFYCSTRAAAKKINKKSIL